MPPPPKSCRPLVTSAVLIETSAGAFVIDLYGLDCPAATAELVNMCRCKYFNGCIVTEVVPDNIIIFSHPVESLRGLTFHSLAEKASSHTQGYGGKSAANMDQLVRGEWERMKRHTAHLQRRNGTMSVEFLLQPATQEAGSINRRGLLLLEVPPKVELTGSGVPVRKSALVLTLGNRHLDYFEDRFMVVGEVREGISVIEKLRAAPYQRTSSASAIGARLTRLIRIKHATVLPTAGTEKFQDVWCNSSSDSSASVQSNKLGSTLAAAGCFRHWAAKGEVRFANCALIKTIKDASVAEGVAKGSQGTNFVLIRESPLRGASHVMSDADEVESVEYNPHYHGDYLSSDDETPHAESRKERESRHQTIMRMHQDKLNETRALMLNLLDGVADVSGELKPPENVLFVCKLNPFTNDEGLKMCFSQCGRVLSAEVLRDRKTGNSLCYGFVEFEDVEACYRAFKKMDKVLVDDHRIHVDFSQSVSKLWAQRQRDMRKRARVES
ncbi:putative RNA-binding protein [Trypanosoma rangeli]|uniref:Peptidyl-prolyl cis-trans isomerase n=1 Tax=Trypanosoma rangeli TaxID=5698 RepID=A0A422MVZ8_TRYRA|nr:putative RNA-binding protein [Trypanosoma rangeli]RNE97404.1 putative RNA-binding protein [Trypanosoma rangeli]|eukprot:RNE97404.1 putative RNA-binding protein [Trypanosoma rangeli]